MKKKFFNLLSRPLSALCLGAMVCMSMAANAQTPIPASTFGQALPYVPYNEMAQLSTASIESQERGTTLNAIAASDWNETNLFLLTGDDASTIINLDVGSDFWSQVDVAIADHENPAYWGIRYHVGLIFKRVTGSGRDKVVKQYEIEIDPSLHLHVIDSAEQILGSDPLWYTDINCRIDALPNENLNMIPGTNMPVMDRFILVHSDLFGSNTTTVSELEANLLSPPTFYNGLFPIGFFGKDIAGYIDQISGQTHAVVATMNGNDVYCYDLDLSVPGGGVISNNYYGYCNLAWGRIEAFGVYDGGAGLAKWAMVNTLNMPMSDVWVYNDLTGPFNAISTLGGTHEYPTIAAGIGPSLSGGQIGNNQFSFAWGATTDHNYYAMSIDKAGNPINPWDCNIVNFTPLSNMTSDPSDLISMSNACNSGSNTLTAWNQDGKILYKVDFSNMYQFRPGQSSEPKELSVTNIYPNPAVDVLHINNAENVSSISFVNSLGAEVLNQKVTNSTIDVSQLPAGMYQVNITETSGKVINKKLVIKH